MYLNRKITFDDKSSDLAFEYDASGNRTAKIEQKKDQSTYSVLAPSEWKYTYYVHDAKGNIMSVYEKNPTLVVGGAANNLIQTQVPIYGSSRIGLFDPEVDLTATTSVSSTFARRFLKQKQYELTNHLGNVLTTISDRKLKNSGGAIAYSAEIISAQDYYPFGMIMPGRNYNPDNYRFGFNGKEKDDEVKGMGNQQDYGMRIFDTRLGRFLSIDPIANYYPMLTPFQFATNTPNQAIDIDGCEAFIITSVQSTKNNTAIITITSDVEVKDNFSCKFQLKLPDGTVYDNWTIDGLKEHFETLKRENGNYTLNDKIISSHPAVPSGERAMNGKKMDDFTYRVELPIDKLSFKTETKVPYREIFGNFSSDKNVDDLTGKKLKGYITHIGGDKINYNRLDVYVPEGKKETFLEKAKQAGIDPKIVNFVDQTEKGSTMEILPVRVETKELKPD